MCVALKTLPAALLLLATSATAAVPGEVIVAHNLSTGRYAAMSATNGGNFVEVACGGDLTHGGSPRYFLSSVAGTNVMPDGYHNSELTAADEDCVQRLVISDTGTMRFSSTPHWSPDGSRIAVYAEQFDQEMLVERGIFVADVVRAAASSRPTGIANLHLAIPFSRTQGEVLISWSGDSQRIAYVGSAPNGGSGQQADIFIFDLGANLSVNVTNTPDVNEDHPAYSPASEHIAFIRLITVRGTYRYDIFTMSASGGTALQVTTKGTTGAAQNLFPCFSPDGQYLSFASGSSLFAFDIYRTKADGSGKAVNLTGKRTGSFRYNWWRR